MRSLRKTLFCLFLTAAVAISVSACSDGGQSDDSTGSFSIDCPPGEWYDISCDYSIAPAGTNVTVTVLPDPFLSTESVYANEVKCDPGTEENTWTFSMPAEDVTLTALFSDAPEILSAEDGMGWVVAPDQLSVAKSGDSAFIAKQSFEVTFGTDPIPASITTGEDNSPTLLYTKVISTNENVLPVSAVSNISSTGNGAYAYGASFSVDLTKVGTGSATLVFCDTENDRFISRSITVADYGEVYDGETWTVSVDVDFSGLDEADKARDLCVWLSESTSSYVYGSCYAQNQQKDLEGYPENGLASFTFTYRPEGKFQLQIGYRDENQIFYPRFVPVSGVSEDGTIVFSEDGEKITVAVESGENK